MPNQRVTFRCPPDLLALLPENPNERSRFILDVLRERLRSTDPQQELEALKRDVLAMKRQLNSR